MFKILLMRSDGIFQRYNVKNRKDYIAIGKHNRRNVHGKIIKERRLPPREAEVVRPKKNIQLTAHLRSDNYGVIGHAISFRASVTTIVSSEWSTSDIDRWFNKTKEYMKARAIRFGFSSALVNAVFGTEIEEFREDTEEDIGQSDENFQYSRDGKKWINF